MASADAGDAGAGVVAADHGFRDDDMAFGVAAEDGLVAVQRENQPGFAAADENEMGHDIVSGMIRNIRDRPRRYAIALTAHRDDVGSSVARHVWRRRPRRCRAAPLP